MNLIITRNFPPDVGGMQNLMFGLTKSLSEHMMVKVFADEHYQQNKFDEDLYVEELNEYVNSTYSSHYSKDKFQATEFIMDGGHGTGFCIGNVLKYAQSYGKKGTAADDRKDLMKVLPVFFVLKMR